MFCNLVIVLGASFVWRVLRTKCPVNDALTFKNTLLNKYNIQVPVFTWEDKNYLRYSVQAYNSVDDCCYSSYDPVDGNCDGIIGTSDCPEECPGGDDGGGTSGGDEAYGIDIDSSYISNGFSDPKLIDLNGEYFLFVGSYSGVVYLYNNIDGNLNGSKLILLI